MIHMDSAGSEHICSMPKQNVDLKNQSIIRWRD